MPVMLQKQNRRMLKNKVTTSLPKPMLREFIWICQKLKHLKVFHSQANPIGELWLMKEPISNSVILWNKVWHD
jgi:hypothetical protein